MLHGAKRHEVKLGRPYIYRGKRAEQSIFNDDHQRQEGLEFILNLPTKDHWRSGSKLLDIILIPSLCGKRLRGWIIIEVINNPHPNSPIENGGTFRNLLIGIWV